MATEQQTEEVPSSRPHRSGLLRQPEIEEVDEEDTSPGSDQSDTTITAGTDTPRVTGGESPESGSPDDLKPTISPKIKQLTRSEAICEGCASPPLDPLQSTASTCSTDSSSSGIGTKSMTSGSLSGSSFRGRLEKDGSQSSEAGTSSSLSREFSDSSVDTPYKDSTGIDLEEFIKKTLNKTPKDRSMLIKLEGDLIKFIKEPKHHYLKFPQMSSYDRMLVHRIAAFFGLDHNVDQTGKCVIVNKTANTRIPDFSFQEHITSIGGESKPKMLLKRGGGSFDESQTRNLQKPSLDTTRAAKSLEERKQQYEEARSRIFTDGEQGEVQPYTQEEMTVSDIMKGAGPQAITKDEQGVSEVRGYGVEGSCKARIVVPKANSFGGTGTFVLQPIKSPMRCSSLTKADSLSMQVGTLQPNVGSPLVRPVLMSSPTCSQSDTSSLSGSSSSGLAPSPQQQSSGTGSLPAQSSPGPKYYWTPTEMSPVAPGGLIINPQTGQPLFNPDGTVYRYTPGQPLPQVWTTQMSQDSQSSQELCQQMTTVLMLSQQSSQDSDSGCAAGGDCTTIPQQVVINQNTQQQHQPSAQQQPFQQQQQQQHAVVVGQQGLYYSGAQPVLGQPGVRYMCPVNYCVSNSGGGFQQAYGPGQGVQMEGHTQNLQFQSNPYCQQYIQGYPTNQMFSQGQFIGGQGQSSNVSYQCGGHGVTSPVEGQNGSMSVGYNLPMQYNQQSMNLPNSSQMFYSVQTPQSNQPQMQGYSAVSGQQQTTYQNNNPPSQGSSANPNVQLNTITPQPVNVNNINTVNMPQQQALGMTPQGLGTQPTQFISYPPSHHTLTHTPQIPQPFTSPQIRSVTPKVVPLQGVPTHGQVPGQTFQTVYQPNMQMPMQIQPHPSQQQAGLVTKSTHMGSQQVTVSAKSVSYDPSPVPSGVENGSGEKGGITAITEGQTSVGNSFRPTHVSTSNHGEIRLQFHSTAPQVKQPAQFAQPQQQSLSKSPTAPKPQRIKKSRSRDSQQSQHSTDTGTMLISNILEVCDLPSHLKWSEVEKLLQDLIVSGARIVPKGDQDGSQGDFNSNNQTISSETRVFAIFSDSNSAARSMQTHSSNSYKLKPVDSISESQA